MHWKKPWFQLTILILLAFVWGSSFILMKIGLKSFSSEQAAGIRMLLASLVLLPYSIKNLKFLQRKDFPSILVAGFIGSFIPAFLFTKAQTQIDSALAGMLNSLTPLFTLLVGILFFKTKFKWLQTIGLVVGLIGALGLITSGKELNFGSINSYALLIVLATSFYGININTIKAKLSHLSGVQITSLSFFFTGPAALIYLLTTDFQPVFATPNWPIHFLALAALGIIGTALAMLLMNSLIRHISAVYASSVTYIIPIFAIFWGVVDGENITLLHLACMSGILLGVYLINKK
ncbi:DMT family transporter [Marinifilum sp. D714]|uniref:DMT family transporter n=1 Tax=Marinifilum sp. D714 TaxID=2937523 RepID=UPI0027BC24C8|nr:DMT family transporter [Marinifilum sp. D714]MDQ2179459.1 DMT family transporter [Marinifilum sp. D714]